MACRHAPLSPLADPVGAQLQQMLSTSGLDTVIVPIGGDIRSNISLTQPMELLPRSTSLVRHSAPTERDRLISAVASNLGATNWLVCAGSLPAGVRDDWYGELVELGRRHGVQVAVDTSGEPMTQSLHARPDLVKPNVHELAELTGAMPSTLGEVIEAAKEVRHRGARTVLASLGADGAVLVDADGARMGPCARNRCGEHRGSGRRDARRVPQLPPRPCSSACHCVAVGRCRRPA